MWTVYLIIDRAFGRYRSCSSNHRYSACCRLTLHNEQCEVQCSCGQNLVEITKLLIDFGRIRNGAGYFSSECFAITPAQTREPGAQRGDWNCKVFGGFFRTERCFAAASNERP